jgi:hypothetical protein
MRPMRWRDAVLVSLRSFRDRPGTRMIARQEFITEELPRIISATGSTGRTPHQTLSRVLQELRDDGLIDFLGNGSYFLQDATIDIDEEDLTDEALDLAIRSRRLILRDVETATPTVLARRRRGQDRLRRLSLEQYSETCAVCDISELALLIASHIIPWAQAPTYRGRLDNVICLCRFHDVLFERGYWSLADDFSIIKRPIAVGRPVRLLLNDMNAYRLPTSFVPAQEFIREHRRRFGFG